MVDTTAKGLRELDVAVPQPELTQRIYGWVIWGSLAVLLAWSFFPAEMDRLPELWTGAGNMAVLLSDFSEPSFRYWRDYLDLILETVQMAVWGSVIAVVLSVPFGLLSSANITPAWIRFPVRRLMDAFRAINDLVFALIFVAAVGLGPLAGVMALAVHTIGTLAKLFSEAVEAIDPRPVEGIRATGASHIQEIVFGVIPQVLPLWISYSLYRFEANVRSATVLGFVGAGGIGIALFDTMRSFNFAAASAILLMIIVIVSLLDILSQLLRKAVIDGEEVERLVAFLGFLLAVFVAAELLLARVIDIDPLLRAL